MSKKDGSRTVDEFDAPLGGLPPAGRIQFERTHMETVVAEFRFPTEQVELPQTAALAVWSRLGRAEFPFMEASQFQSMTLQVSPGRTEHAVMTTHGWALSSADRAVTVLLMPGTVVITTSRYERFSTSLGDLAAEVIQAYLAVIQHEVVHRVGLRYINRLADDAATSPLFWGARIRAPFVGPLVDEEAGRNVVAVHQQTQLRLTDTAGAMVHNGVIVQDSDTGRCDYLIDLDVFQERAQSVDLVQIRNTLRQLNRTALSLFTQILADEYLLGMGPSELVEG